MFFLKKKNKAMDSKAISEIVNKADEYFDTLNPPEIPKETPAPKEDGIKYSRKDNSFTMSPAMQALMEEIEAKNKWKERETFSDKIERFIQEKKLTSVQFYKAADIDRKVYSAMHNNKNYQPKKETAIASCFGLNLYYHEAEELLKSAGYSLSNSIRRDVIIMYCLNEHKFSIYDVNAILDAAGEKSLR